MTGSELSDSCVSCHVKETGQGCVAQRFKNCCVISSENRSLIGRLLASSRAADIWSQPGLDVKSGDRVLTAERQKGRRTEAMTAERCSPWSTGRKNLYLSGLTQPLRYQELTLGICTVHGSKNVSRDPQDIQNMMKAKIVEFAMTEHGFCEHGCRFKRNLGFDIDPGADCRIENKTQPDV